MNKKQAWIGSNASRWNMWEVLSKDSLDVGWSWTLLVWLEQINNRIVYSLRIISPKKYKPITAAVGINTQTIYELRKMVIDIKTRNKI